MSRSVDKILEHPSLGSMVTLHRKLEDSLLERVDRFRGAGEGIKVIVDPLPGAALGRCVRRVYEGLKTGPGGREAIRLGAFELRGLVPGDYVLRAHHFAFAMREMGIESIMVNSNPETVSTDYDTSHRLYFEPLTEEDILAIVKRERPKGVVLQFGGQTPLKLANALEVAEDAGKGSGTVTSKPAPRIWLLFSAA